MCGLRYMCIRSAMDCIFKCLQGSPHMCLNDNLIAARTKKEKTNRKKRLLKAGSADCLILSRCQ